MDENQKIEIAGETADIIYFEIINELGPQEKEKFVKPDKENTNEKGEIVGTKNTELGSEVYMSIESELISLIERIIKPQANERNK